MTALNDAWIFSLNDYRWLKIELTSQLKPRCNFSTALDKESGKIYIFGGISTSDNFLNDLVSLKINLKMNEAGEEGIRMLKDDLEERQSFAGNVMQDYFIR